MHRIARENGLKGREKKEPSEETKKNWLQVHNVTKAKRVSRIIFFNTLKILTLCNRDCIIDWTSFFFF